jgi:hypothetical protein
MRGRRLGPSGQLQQRLRQPAGEAQIHHVFDLLAGVADARAQDLDELERDIRLRAQERNEIAPVDHHQLGVIHGYGIGRARAPVEEGDLAEYFPGVDDVEHGFAAVGGGDADLHRPPQHRHQAGARIAFGKNGGGPPHRAAGHVSAEVLDHSGRKFAE